MDTQGDASPKANVTNIDYKPTYDHLDEMYKNSIRALNKKSINRTPEEDFDLKLMIRTIAFFHNILSGEEYEFFVKDFAEHLSIKTITPGKAVYHKGEFDDHFYMVLKGNVVMYREDTTHSIYESEEFKYQDENDKDPEKEKPRDSFKVKNNAALRDLELIMSDKAKKSQGSLEASGVPDYRMFDPEKFDVGVSKFIYLMSKYDPKKSKVDPYGPEVDDETKFIFDYSLLFYAQIERPDKYYRAGKFHYRPVRRFKRGEYFGEAGMIVSQPRTETAIAADEVIVAYIPRKKTLAYFPQIMEAMEFRMKYIIPFFKVINHVYVVKLCAAMKEEYFDHGTCVFQQGQRLMGFYVIIEGEVEIVKDISVNKYLINDPRSMHSFKTRRYLIDTVKEGQIFGEDDLLFEKNMGYFALVKSKNLHVIRMTAKIFETFYKHYPYIFDDFYVYASLKRKNRQGKTSLIMDPSSVAERKKYLYVAALQPGQSKEYIEKIVHMQEEEKKNENPKPKLRIPKPRLKTFFSRLQVPKFIEKMKDALPTHKQQRIIPLVSVILDFKEEQNNLVFNPDLFKRDSVRESKRSNSDYQKMSSTSRSVVPSLQNLEHHSSQNLQERLSKAENSSPPILTDDPIINAVAKAVKHHIEVQEEIKEDDESSNNSIDIEIRKNSLPSNIPQIESPKFETSPFAENAESLEFTKNEETIDDMSKSKINNIIESLETPGRYKIKLPTIVSPIRRIETDPDNPDSNRKYPLHLRLNSILKNSMNIDDNEELYSTLRKKYDQMVSPKSSRVFKLTSLPNNVSQSYNTDSIVSRVDSYYSAASVATYNPMSPLSPKIKPKVMLSPKMSVKKELDFGMSPKKKVSDLRLTVTIQKKKIC